MNKEASAQAQMEFNLSVLQRMDKNIISVLFTSKHVTLYILDDNTQGWVIFKIVLITLLIKIAEKKGSQRPLVRCRQKNCTFISNSSVKSIKHRTQH
jgi:hypothetical protein